MPNPPAPHTEDCPLDCPHPHECNDGCGGGLHVITAFAEGTPADIEADPRPFVRAFERVHRQTKGQPVTVRGMVVHADQPPRMVRGLACTKVTIVFLIRGAPLAPV